MSTLVDQRATKQILNIFASAIALSFVALPFSGAQAGTEGSATCGQNVLAKLKEKSADEDSRIAVACSLILDPSDVIEKNILISGAGAEGLVLDCRGATIRSPKVRAEYKRPLITITSERVDENNWSAPSNVTIKNCVIEGDLQIFGAGQSANDPVVRDSSLRENHTQAMQRAAPRNISILSSTLVAKGGTAIYIGPGVTKVLIENSKFNGYSRGAAIYLDAESAFNTISNNDFKFESKTRELIAVDGSASNNISKNIFHNPQKGGIYIYRNCGEAGTIRHQRPQFNQIRSNEFIYEAGTTPRPAVWLNSRKGKSKFCFRDPAHPYGSSLSPMDFAMNNVVQKNTLKNGSLSLIDNDDSSNSVTDNVVSK
jgi:parallel beta-helix repeat protein